MKPIKSTQLFFQEGTSDKLYHATIFEDAGAYTVKVKWGRRNAKLNEGTKALKVTLAQAESTFDRLVREKTGKGYQAVSAGVKPAPVAPLAGQGSSSKVTGKRAKVGFSAQLLNPIEDDELEAFLADETVLAQQKLDGNRVLVHLEEEPFATNRDGQRTTIATEIFEGLSSLPLGTVVDGEIIGGDVYWLFDVIRVGGRDVVALGCEERWRLLAEELEPGLSAPIRVLGAAIGQKQKRALHEKLTAAGAEGMVFKQRGAPYKAGRPASGGTQRKHKFIKSADVVLLSNAGNAYLMGVYDGPKRVEVGKVFAGTTNASRKAIDGLLGAGTQPVAEVRYLYATDDEQLFQPVFVRLRTDKAATACVRGQLLKTNRAVVE